MVIDREEYLATRSVYIKGGRISSDTLQKIILLIASGGFIYTKSFIGEFEKCSFILLMCSRGFFAISIISSILLFYFSGQSHEIQLDIYDREYDKEVCEEYDNDLKNKKKKLHKTNGLIDIMELSGIVGIIFGILLLFISFLV